MIPSLEDDDLFSQVLPALGPTSDPNEDGAPEGIEVLENEESDAGNDEVSDVERISALVDLFASSDGEPEITLPTDEGERTEGRVEVRDSLKDTLRGAAAEITDDRCNDNRLERPLNRALEAERKLRGAHEALDRVADHPDFDAAPLREALDGVRERLNSLVAATEQSA